MKQSTFSIIGERYLDTQHDSEYIAGLEKELEDRGIVGIRRWILEYIAASSLWWNIIWWDWCSLDEKDIKIGWAQNLVCFSIPAFIFGYISNVIVGVSIFVILHLITTKIGFGLRQGSKLNK